MTFDQIIKALEKELGIDLSADNVDRTSSEPLVVYVDDIAVELSQQGGDLFCLETELCGLPGAGEEREALYGDMLAACAAGAVNFGASLYLDLPSNQILLRRTYPLMQFAELNVSKVLSDFVSNVDYYNNAV